MTPDMKACRAVKSRPRLVHTTSSPSRTVSGGSRREAARTSDRERVGEVHALPGPHVPKPMDAGADQGPVAVPLRFVLTPAAQASCPRELVHGPGPGDLGRPDGTWRSGSGHTFRERGTALQ